MDVISILNGVKNKVLDAKHYDLLKHAYDLQNENIEQLKSNNEAFKESNQLLKEEIKSLNKTNESLRQVEGELREKLSRFASENTSAEFSQIARAILKIYLGHDKTNLWENQIHKSLNYSQIKVKAAIDELVKCNIVRMSRLSNDYGPMYSLTNEGRKYLAENTLD